MILMILVVRCEYMVKYCSNCGFPDTRPGIYFENGLCQGCLYEQEKEKIDWEKRWFELQDFVKKKKDLNNLYDCVIAISGGKDSHYQTHIFREVLGLRCLFVCVSDNMTVTKAGAHNLRNIQEKFGSDLFIFKINPVTQRKIMRYTFEEYGRPNYIIDRLIYTIPIWIAYKMRIPLVIYGENVAVTRGLKNNEDTWNAWNQMYNSVASNYNLEEICKKCDVDYNELRLAQFPPEYARGITTPIYTSYFLKWDGYEHYKFAKSIGFKTLEGEWDRLGGNINYWQIDTYGYLIDSNLKYAKLGHSYVMDLVCELIRTGHMTKEEGKEIIEEWDGVIDPKMLDDFCNFLGYTHDEFYEIYEGFLNARYDAECRV